MPSYAKFLKELLTKKRKPLDDEMVSMTEECSALIQRKLPQKKKDPGSFTIPCSIGTLTIEKALCDLGASINLMPLSMMKKIPGAVAKPTKMSLSLADRSVVHPEGILHDVLVKVAGFVFPADFVVLDIEETREWEPLLLGRPFLATSRALIDVEMGELMLRTDDQQVTFNVFDKMECDDGDPQCFKIQVNSDCINEYIKETVPKTNVVPDVYTFVAPDTGVGKNDQDKPDQIRTMSDLGDCYDKLVREFVVNVAKNCDDPKNAKYRQVFVRGRCVHFSPSIINKFLGRSVDEVAGLKATYINWVPTTHSSNVAKELARFIYAVGTKARFDYGSYVFDATLEHAVSFALQLPIAFPTLLCGIILDQHPTILVDADVPCRRASKLTVSKNLLSGTHVDAGVGTSVQQKAGALTR
ncbi:unnamed protein product [Trifolium pratense]|uniref:Uncharacterized protein n=1 Tax=Trifolium pratense TaxID=57577 RepID=A0ACB0KN57_TRIPR|nr:unnamed protein product [Trifolium pratense]